MKHQRIGRYNTANPVWTLGPNSSKHLSMHLHIKGMQTFYPATSGELHFGEAYYILDA